MKYVYIETLVSRTKLSIPNNKENKASCWSVKNYPHFSWKLHKVPPLSEKITVRFSSIAFRLFRVFLALVPHDHDAPPLSTRRPRRAHASTPAETAALAFVFTSQPPLPISHQAPPTAPSGCLPHRTDCIRPPIPTPARLQPPLDAFLPHAHMPAAACKHRQLACLLHLACYNRPVQKHQPAAAHACIHRTAPTASCS
jgi:hypothetical protein